MIYDGIQTRLLVRIVALKAQVPVDGHSQHCTPVLCGLVILLQI